MAGINSYTNLVELIRDYYDLDVGTYYNQSITLGSTTLTCDIYRVSNNTALTSSVFTRCTSNDANTQIVIGKNLSVASGVTLRPPYRCKGIIIGSPKTFTNNGTISMTARGASGEGKEIPIFSSYKISAVGGAGGAGKYVDGRGYTSQCDNGNDGSSPQSGIISCGGGGSGGGCAMNTTFTSGAGGAGTSFSGGAGGSLTQSGSSTGGAGGNSSITSSYNHVRGGAGNPKGTDNCYSDSDSNGTGTGGLLIVISEKISGSGNFISQGSQGPGLTTKVTASSSYEKSGGGASGGGCVVVLGRSVNITGSLDASGGAASVNVYSTGIASDSYANGGKGGDGSVVNLTSNNLVLTNGEDLSLGITESQYLSQIPIVSGRLVALSDKDEMYYEYDDTRHRVGSGHNVKNSSSTTLETRSSLKFDTPFTVTDDSTNDATVIGQLTLGTSDLADFDEPSQASTGVTNISQMADVAISSATSGQALVYNGSKWANSYRDYHEYSTTEKVVGKWVDGSTVYEKTISSTLPTCSSDGSMASSYVNIGASISKGWIVSAYVINTSSHQIFTCPYILYTSTSSWQIMEVNLNDKSATANANTVRIQHNKASWSGYNIYITVRYTKV